MSKRRVECLLGFIISRQVVAFLLSLLAFPSNLFCLFFYETKHA